MKDMQTRLAKLLDDASDCDLISNLATDQRKRATFRRMARELREVAARLRSDIAARGEPAPEDRRERHGFH